VCVELDKKEEALQAFARVTAPVLRRELAHRLQRRGWLTTAIEDTPTLVAVTEADLRPSTREKLADALELLLCRRMRWAVLAGTVAFPVALGVGGMLCGLSDLFLLRFLALVPPLFVVGMVGAFGRHVLVQALHAVDDASTLPRPQTLLPEMLHGLRDLGAPSAAFLLPGYVALLLDQALLALLLFVLAAALLPMAVALRLLSRDWRALSPKLLLAAARACPSYFGTAAVLALLFVPALLTLFLSVGQPWFLVISVVGPLAVAPFFVAMRMLGLTLHYERAGVARMFKLPDPHTAQRRAQNTTSAGTHSTENSIRRQVVRT
jgi:hypothetical protein